MKRINVILEADADGTLHLPIPAELRSGKVQVIATVAPIDSQRVVGDAVVGRRKAALASLREAGGLGGVIEDAAAWQREQRRDRPLPGRP